MLPFVLAPPLPPLPPPLPIPIPRGPLVEDATVEPERRLLLLAETAAAEKATAEGLDQSRVTPLLGKKG